MKFLTILLIIIPLASYGQGSKGAVYTPDGTRYEGAFKTIGDLNKEFDKYGRVYSEAVFSDEGDYLTMVGYKLFTDKPFWVMAKDTTRIKEAISKFNLDQYFRSFNFEMDLESCIEKGTLTDLFTLDTLGTPDNKVKYFSKNIEFERWTYDYLALILVMKKGVAISYTRF